ncbi:MAG: hypothetical protein KA123_00415 [Candidatus Eisenbacteria bacterium]|nr:hypothetical protein [Candidatus Eisenbacteria bacterium]
MIRATNKTKLMGWVLAGLAGWAGCGYSFSGTSLPAYIESVAIPTFRNDTLDATIASEVTRGVTERFVQDNRLKIGREASAGAVLEGRVVAYERNVYNYNASQVPESYIIVVRVSVVLKDRVKNRDLWKDEALTSTATFPAEGQQAVGAGTPQDEQEARDAVVKNLAQDILAKTLEQW